MASDKESPSPTDKKAGSHARATARKPRKKAKAKGHGGTVEGRIAFIESMMRSLTFRTGKTGKQLAAKWGLALSTVEAATAEASRRVRASVMGDREHIGASVGAALETALQNAIAAKEWRVVAQLADTWAKISGVSAATRTELTGKDGAPIAHFTLNGLTDEQIDRVLSGDAAPPPGSGGGGEGTKGD